MVDVVGGDGTVLRRKPWLTFSLLSSPASRYGLDFTHLSANRINAKDRQRKRIVRMSQWHAVDASVRDGNPLRNAGYRLALADPFKEVRCPPRLGDLTENSQTTR